MAGRYRLVERVAVGGMGEVWRAFDQKLRRPVAVKLLLDVFAADEVFRERFRAEARAAALIAHPNVVPVYDYGQELCGGGWLAYLVMEYVEGPTVAEKLSAEGRLSVAATLSIVGQVGFALQAAHDRGVVHRDIKPGNLLLNASGTVKVTDFGIARAGDAVPLTQTGTILGTAAFISPEQARGDRSTPASDLYSLGAVAYTCLGGAPPFRDGAPATIALAHLQDPPPPLPGDVPIGVQNLVLRLLAKDPAARPASGAALARLVDRIGDRGRTAADRLPDTSAVGVGSGTPTVRSEDLCDTEPSEPVTTAALAVAVGVPALAPWRLVVATGRAAWSAHRFAVSAVVAAVLFGSTAVSLAASGSSSAAVPAAIGSQIATARGLLARAGLDPVVRTVDVPTKAAGIVVGENPAAGRKLARHSRVSLTVASGKVRIPDGLTGKNYAQAVATLQALGLRVEEATQTTSAYTAGVVVSVVPGGEVAVDSTVVLTVAASPIVVQRQVTVYQQAAAANRGPPPPKPAPGPPPPAPAPPAPAPQPPAH